MFKIVLGSRQSKFNLNTLITMFLFLLNCLQIRCFSCLFGKAREMNFAIPDDKAWTTEGKYEGATVLEPKKGAYFTPIAALDFAR